jgi:hypothetical protein
MEVINPCINVSTLRLVYDGQWPGSYVWPDVRVSSNKVQWKIGGIPLEKSGGLFAVTGCLNRACPPAAGGWINDDRNSSEWCYRGTEPHMTLSWKIIHVGRKPEPPTGFYCITQDYEKTKCVWRTGRLTNLWTKYTLFYAMVEDVTRPGVSVFKPCVSSSVLGEFREMECAPSELRDSTEGFSWLYRLHYAFFLTAENPLGSLSTDTTVLSMESILRTSSVTGLGLGNKTGGGVLIASNPITWGRPAAPRVSFQDLLVARVHYSPIGCPAAYSFEERNVSMSWDGGVHHPSALLTPGLRYNVSVAARPVASLKWPLDVYWSDPSFFEAATPEAAPTAAPNFSFPDLSVKTFRIIIPVCWQPIPCENRGSSGTLIYEVRVRSLVDSKDADGYYLDRIFELRERHCQYVAADELQPYTGYGVEVRARNSAGAGPWSGVRIYRTPSAAPAPPRDVVALLVTNVSAIVAWRPSRQPYSPVASYKIHVLNTQNQVYKELVHGDLSLQRASVSGLAPCSSYNVSVSECARDGACGPATGVGFNTSGACPPPDNKPVIRLSPLTFFW